MDLSRRSFFRAALVAAALPVAAKLSAVLPAPPIAAAVNIEAIRDCYAAALARSFVETKEKLAFEILNRAFSYSPDDGLYAIARGA